MVTRYLRFPFHVLPATRENAAGCRNPFRKLAKYLEHRIHCLLVDRVEKPDPNEKHSAP